MYIRSLSHGDLALTVWLLTRGGWNTHMARAFHNSIIAGNALRQGLRKTRDGKIDRVIRQNGVLAAAYPKKRAV